MKNQQQSWYKNIGEDINAGNSSKKCSSNSSTTIKMMTFKCKKLIWTNSRHMICQSLISIFLRILILKITLLSRNTFSLQLKNKPKGNKIRGFSQLKKRSINKSHPILKWIITSWNKKNSVKKKSTKKYKIRKWWSNGDLKTPLL